MIQFIVTIPVFFVLGLYFLIKPDNLLLKYYEKEYGKKKAIFRMRLLGLIMLIISIIFILIIFKII
jgi:hypothetical protein